MSPRLALLLIGLSSLSLVACDPSDDDDSTPSDDDDDASPDDDDSTPSDDDDASPDDDDASSDDDDSAVPDFALVASMVDGTVRDVAASESEIFLAQGRNLARLDPSTGQRIDDEEGSPYPASLQAVEYDAGTDTLFVATSEAVYVKTSDGTTRTWAEGVEDVMDIKVAPSSELLLVIELYRIVLIDYGGAELTILSEIVLEDLPWLDELIVFFRRIQLAEVDGSLFAWIPGQLAAATRRGSYALVVIDLDSAAGFAAPSVLPVWDPDPALLAWEQANGVAEGTYSGTGASVYYLEILPSVDPSHLAYVAAHDGQLLKLDVSNPAAPVLLDVIQLAEGHPVDNIVADSPKSRLYVASLNVLHSLDTATGDVVGSQNVGFGKGGSRDMAVVSTAAGSSMVWTGTHQPVAYVVNGIEVQQGASSDGIAVAHALWWISSSDGAVVAPDWDSLYLPTFGGVGRYDLSDVNNPVAVPDGYEPSGPTLTEHIELVWPDAADPDQALLLTATGTGSVQLWPISASEPGPGAPVTIERPELGNPPPVYGNDVSFYQRDGQTWVLADAGIRGQINEVVLIAYPLSLSAEGAWTSSSESALTASEGLPALKANAKQVAVGADHAFISCHGGFFVVDLGDLPASMTTVAEVPVNLDGDTDAEGAERYDDVQGLALDSTGTRLFIATDSSRAVASYTFDPKTGAVTGPDSVLMYPDSLGAPLPGTTSRARYHAESERFYVAGRQGTIVAVDVSNPDALQLISIWSDGSTSGETQDVRIIDLGAGPRVLMVSDNEGFRILDPNDGL